jgi:hypothetical protein
VSVRPRVITYEADTLSVTSSYQLAGRVLLVFLFVGFVFQGQFSVFRLLVSLVGLGACVMVAVGFKAKWSASFLVTGLSVANVFVNNWYVKEIGYPESLLMPIRSCRQVESAPFQPYSGLQAIRLFPDFV